MLFPSDTDIILPRYHVESHSDYTSFLGSRAPRGVLNDAVERGALVHVYTRKCHRMRASEFESPFRSAPRRKAAGFVACFSRSRLSAFSLRSLLYSSLVFRFLSDCASDTRSPVIVINLPIYTYIPGTL